AILGNLRLPGPTRLTLRCSGLVGSLVSEVQQPRGFLLRDFDQDSPGRPQSNTQFLCPALRECRIRIGTPDHCSGSPKDRESTRLNSSHVTISYAVFCLKQKTQDLQT